MKHECYKITVPGHTADLHTYILASTPEIKIDKRPMVIVCPGGGYSFTSDREAEPIAMALLAEGIHACVLRYSVAPARFPAALTQLAKAVALVREHAEEWHVDPDKIAVMGFSAGGHLAASLGVFWDKAFLAEDAGLSPAAMKPNGMLLCYPVITSGKYNHGGSFDNLLGDEKADQEKRELVSLEKRVTGSTPPAFLWHTYEDQSVPVENSLLMMNALRDSGVRFEAHIYPRGRHGLSLATALTDSPKSDGAVLPEASGWMDLACRWVLGL